MYLNLNTMIFKQALTNLIQNSELPPAVVVEILDNALYDVRDLARSLAQKELNEKTAKENEADGNTDEKGVVE